jgi:DNA-binding transcriptional LysR family regulator
MNWDDFRFVLALSKAGSLARAAKALEVDHTTVGRRIDSAEAALGVKLFTRTSTGYVPTAEAERLLQPMQAVEAAVLSVERGAQSTRESLEGTVRVTSPETFGISYLAPRLAAFGLQHPGVTIELNPVGEVLDLGRREAEVAVRFFRSRQQNLVVRRVGEVSYGFYASPEYLSRRPVKSPSDLSSHALLLATPGPNVPEVAWLKKLNPNARPAFVSTISLVLSAAARASRGLAILPRYLGDSDPTLRRVPMPDPPTEPVWLTVHRDLRSTPRVRVLLDFLVRSIEDDATMLRGL